MTANHHCLIHGLVLASEVALPIPQVEPRPADISYRIALGTSLPASSHARSDDPEEPWAIEHWLDDRLAVEFPGRATFVLSESDVVLASDSTGDPDLVAHLLLDHVLPRVVALRGDLMLHASGAVGPSGRAHLFLGRTGAGKSTIVAGLVARGWSLLNDDGIRITRTGNQMLAVPGAAGVRLLPDSAAAVLPGVQPGQPIARDNPKRRFKVAGGQQHQAAVPAAVAGVYVLNRSDVSRPEVERLGLADAVSAIAEHGFHMANEPTDIARHAFERAVDLAAATPTWRLHSPSGLDRLTATHTLLSRLDSTADGPRLIPPHPDAQSAHGHP